MQPLKCSLSSRFCEANSNVDAESASRFKQRLDIWRLADSAVLKPGLELPLGSLMEVARKKGRERDLRKRTIGPPCDGRIQKVSHLAYGLSLRISAMCGGHLHCGEANYTI